MRRWMIYMAAAAVVLVLRPGQRKDVGDLLPVELVYISREFGQIRVETDTGALGYGKELDSALQDLKDTALGEVFLETADYLVVTERTVHLLPELTAVLRPGTEVCMGIRADAQAAGYLKAHPPGTTMKDIRAGAEEIPILIRSKEQYHFGESRKFRTKA